MFSFEYNGYNKNQVDAYIAKLKASHEQALMEERLKVLDAEKKILELHNKTKEIEEREKNLKSMYDSFKKMQAEGNNNIETLRVEQVKLIYIQMQDFMQDLSAKYPGILTNASYKKMLSDIQGIMSKIDKKDASFAWTDNDSMRVLLNKMQEKRIHEMAKEIKIERTDSKDRQIQLKPLTKMHLDEGDGFDNLVDKFLAEKPVEKEQRTMTFTSNGFDLKEAVTPKDDLSEIMKAFDFFGGDDED